MVIGAAHVGVCRGAFEWKRRRIGSGVVISPNSTLSQNGRVAGFRDHKSEHWRAEFSNCSAFAAVTRTPLANCGGGLYVNSRIPVRPEDPMSESGDGIDIDDLDYRGCFKACADWLLTALC